MKIILASQSPRRRTLLKQLNLNFEIIPSTIEEITSATAPAKIVEELAQLKAFDVAKPLKNALIIGADTIVVYQERILGKPRDRAEAFEMLSSLSGNTHTVFTGVCLIEKDEHGSISKEITFNVATKVTFSSLPEQMIYHYIDTEKPFDKAGSYGIQDDFGAVFVNKICGDFYNVVGLPLNKLYSVLSQSFPKILIG